MDRATWTLPEGEQQRLLTSAHMRFVCPGDGARLILYLLDEEDGGMMRADEVAPLAELWERLGGEDGPLFHISGPQEVG